MTNPIYMNGEDRLNNFSIDQFLEKLIEAITKVEHQYFLVKTTNEPNGIVRERTFCYELYHQFRKATEDDQYQFIFHGELDKRGHLEIAEHNRKIPDFLAHKPGSFEQNEVIIEVKGKISLQDIRLDFKKIHAFLSEVHYQYGVFLLFNHTFGELKRVMQPEFIQEFNPDKDSVFYIICANTADGEVTLHDLSCLREGFHAPRE